MNFLFHMLRHHSKLLIEFYYESFDLSAESRNIGKEYCRIPAAIGKKHRNKQPLESLLYILWRVTLVTRIKPYCFPTVFKRLISVGFQLLISNYQNSTEITLEKTFIQPLKNPTFQTENQPSWNVGNTFFNGCCVTRAGSPSLSKTGPVYGPFFFFLKFLGSMARLALSRYFSPVSCRCPELGWFVGDLTPLAHDDIFV